MATTYDKIATTTLGTAAASIDFTSIAGTYTDLRVVFKWQPTAALNLFIRLNNDSASPFYYSTTYLNGNGTSAASGRDTSSSSWSVNQIVNPSTKLPSFTTIDLFSYAGATNKTALITTSADFNGSGYTQPQISLWRRTDAVTQINLVASSSTFIAGTTATLYGILKA